MNVRIGLVRQMLLRSVSTRLLDINGAKSTKYNRLPVVRAKAPEVRVHRVYPIPKIRNDAGKLVQIKQLPLTRVPRSIVDSEIQP